jgi:hypothetical protein
MVWAGKGLDLASLFIRLCVTLCHPRRKKGGSDFYAGGGWHV